MVSRENPAKIDDLGVPPWLRKPPYFYLPFSATRGPTAPLHRLGFGATPGGAVPEAPPGFGRESMACAAYVLDRLVTTNHSHVIRKIVIKWWRPGFWDTRFSDRPFLCCKEPSCKLWWLKECVWTIQPLPHPADDNPLANVENPSPKSGVRIWMGPRVNQNIYTYALQFHVDVKPP